MILIVGLHWDEGEKELRVRSVAGGMDGRKGRYEKKQVGTEGD